MEATGMEETNTSKALVPPIEVRGMLHFDSEKFRLIKKFYPLLYINI